MKINGNVRIFAMQQMTECFSLLLPSIFAKITFALRKSHLIRRNHFNWFFPIIFILVESQLTFLLATLIFPLNFQFNVFFSELLAFIFSSQFNTIRTNIAWNRIYWHRPFAFPLYLFVFERMGIYWRSGKTVFEICAHIFSCNQQRHNKNKNLQ